MEEQHRVEQGAARGEFEGVEGAVGLQPGGHAQRFGDGQAASDTVFHIEFGDHGQPVPHRVADGPDDLAGEAGAGGGRAAVAVGAAIQ